MDPDPQGDQSGIYVPVAPEQATPLRMIVHVGNRIIASVLMLVASIALLLSTVGVYALMSFTVSQ
jgi:hypothetical protein